MMPTDVVTCLQPKACNENEEEIEENQQVTTTKKDDYTGLFSLVNASNNYFLVGAALTPNKYFSPISGSHSCKSIT